jgi:hypothetical protein
MRVLIALVILAASLSLGGCSHPNQAAHAKPLQSSDPTNASRVKPRPLTVRKLEATQAKRPRPRKLPVLTEATSLRPQSVKKLPELAKTSSVVKPPPLPVRKPEQESPTPSRGDAGTSSSERPGAVGQEGEAKFKAAQAKAKLEGVHALTQEDIDGLSPEQIKELRGY